MESDFSQFIYIPKNFNGFVLPKLAMHNQKQRFMKKTRKTVLTTVLTVKKKIEDCAKNVADVLKRKRFSTRNFTDIYYPYMMDFYECTSYTA